MLTVPEPVFPNYSGINAHFALITRCLKNGNQNPEILGVLVETYSDRALDVLSEV